MENPVECGEASALGIEGFKDDVTLEASAMLVVEVAFGGIAKRSGLANLAVGFDVGASAEGHSNMIFSLHPLCQIE
jgi:hypothetical protein